MEKDLQEFHFGDADLDRCLSGMIEKCQVGCLENSNMMFTKMFGLDFKYSVEENRFLTILLRTEGLEILVSFRW